MDAYNVKLVDDDGKLLVDDPKVKKGLIGALKDYTDPYLKGCTPPSSTSWKDPDNNVAFHNKTTVMTHNFTISIAAKWYEDSQNPALTPEQRAAGKKAYEELIITAAFPKKPDGSPIKYRSDVKTGVIFSQSKNKAKAKEFVKFLLQEENLGPYVEGALGRWFPVTIAGQKSPFWQADRHRKAVYNQFMIIPAMALAGSLAAKKSIPPSAGTLPTTGGLFVGLVIGVILIVGGLTFFPALALGPIVEHLAMSANTLF